MTMALDARSILHDLFRDIRKWKSEIQTLEQEEYIQSDSNIQGCLTSLESAVYGEIERLRQVDESGKVDGSVDCDKLTSQEKKQVTDNNKIINISIYEPKYLRNWEKDPKKVQKTEQRDIDLRVSRKLLDEGNQYSPMNRKMGLLKKLSSSVKRLRQEEFKNKDGTTREKKAMNTFRNDNILVVDIQRAGDDFLGRKQLPVSAVKPTKRKYAKFNLDKSISDNLITRDRYGRLKTALQIAHNNYRYWKSIYKDPALYNGAGDEKKYFHKALKSGLKPYVEGNPSDCKGVIYFYEVYYHDANSDSEKAQIYIGQTERELRERILQHHTSNDTPLFDLFLQIDKLWPQQDLQLTNQSQKLLPKKAVQRKESKTSSSSSTCPPIVATVDADSKLEQPYEPKIIILILDFGFSKSFQKEHKGFIKDDDTLDRLEWNYIKYFGARSPLGLNTLQGKEN